MKPRTCGSRVAPVPLRGCVVASCSLRPFFAFYGGKWRIAPRYPEPVFDTIVEPFAGSAGYSLRHADRDVVLVERDPVIASVWRFLLSASAEQIRSLPDVEEGQTTADLDVEEGARSLIGFWLNKGVASPRKRPSAWMRSGIRPGSFWGPQVRERIASQVDSIRHWRLVEGDAVEVMRALPNLDATWFVDPPYENKGRHYACSSVDYDALGAACRQLRGQVIACEQVGARWLPFQHLVDAKANHATKRSAEAVWASPSLPLVRKGVG